MLVGTRKLASPYDMSRFLRSIRLALCLLDELISTSPEQDRFSAFGNYQPSGFSIQAFHQIAQAILADDADIARQHSGHYLLSGQ